MHALHHREWLLRAHYPTLLKERMSVTLDRRRLALLLPGAHSIRRSFEEVAPSYQLLNASEPHAVSD
ncbi:hypothetical protein AB4144_55735, partial [Rhizobiaceae sp. 2RAB30]